MKYTDNGRMKERKYNVCPGCGTTTIEDEFGITSCRSCAIKNERKMPKPLGALCFFGLRDERGEYTCSNCSYRATIDEVLNKGVCGGRKS